MGLRSKWRPGDEYLIRHKDASILVVEKKAGMLTHAGPEQDEKSLLGSLRRDFANQGRHRMVKAVHRLDRCVSGLLVFARTDRAYEALREQMAAHDVERTYFAGVSGRLEGDSGTIEAFLDVEPMTVEVCDEDHPRAQRAVTHWKVKERIAAGDATLVEVKLETGRRNQIRVHMAHLGHALLGERKYAPRPRAQGKERIFLHAQVLGFRHPLTRETLRFEANPPPDLGRWTAKLRRAPSPRCPAPLAARDPERRRRK